MVLRPRIFYIFFSFFSVSLISTPWNRLIFPSVFLSRFCFFFPKIEYLKFLNSFILSYQYYILSNSFILSYQYYILSNVFSAYNLNRIFLIDAIKL